MRLAVKPVEGDNLLFEVRGEFIRRGTTLNNWCRSNGVDYSYAHKALRGINRGPSAQALRQRLINASRSA